ncbi:MAG: hypothetical protein H7Y43_08395, partial [Akkermansiaceae bacterium]|nr:hypothetical protein [Verrucomicrobiales bacterium]
VIAAAFFLGALNAKLAAQVECATVGNLRGLRVDGELMAFSSSLRAVSSVAEGQGNRGQGGGGGERGGGQFFREGDTLTMSGSLTGGGERGGGRRGGAAATGVRYRVVYKDAAPGSVQAEVEITSNTNLTLQGVFFSLTLPGADYTGGTAQWIGANSETNTTIALDAARASGSNLNQRAMAKGVRVTSARRQFELSFSEPLEIALQEVRSRGSSNVEISFPLCTGNLTNGQNVRAAFTIKAIGEIDTSPARIAVDSSKPGARYDGIGGNFRIQSPADAAEIKYNLENLRVAWARIAMPLDRWHPNEDSDPMLTATNALNSQVREAMEMAQTLAKKNIPTAIAVWSVPDWALAEGSGRGNRGRINLAKWDKLAKSIGSYLEYLKQHYGAEMELFSFNESDIGINVLETAEEHAATIKRLGAHFAARGLKTKLLLGDTGNPTAGKFIDVTMADAEAVKHVGAVSFHSWHSGTTEQYKHFSDAARKLNVPVLIGEGGLDPAAHQYRAVFLEPWFCLNEIAQYVEICRVTQPLSILHWQLTHDYSVLTGGQNGEPLRPAQRFWLLKQLGLTAPGSASLPAMSDNSKVTPCAFTDHGAPVVHLVNNGAARTATVTGLPTGVKEMRVIVTDRRRGMQEAGRVPVTGGTATVQLDAMSLTSLAGN